MATNSTGQIRIFHPTSSLSEENAFTDYELFEGETVIGIGCKKRSKCPVINISFSGSSVAKEHCRVLIDDNEHFIMDLGTKGKTKRRCHILKPNVYYELSDGIDLMLGDLKCQYFTSPMSAREKEEEKKPVEETDLNETRSLNTDATATPSPRPAHSLQMSPLPTLPSFDADNADITGCGSPQLLADPPALTASEQEPTLAYQLSSLPQEDEESHKGTDTTDENDQTLPFDSPVPEDRPITNGVTMDANDDKADDKVEAGGDIVNASDEGKDDLDTTVIIAEDITDTEPYNLEEEQEKEGGGGKEDKTKASVDPSLNTKSGPIASLFNEDDDEAPPLYEPTIAYNLEEDEKRELSSVHSEETGTREKSEEEEKDKEEEEEKKEREEEEGKKEEVKEKEKTEEEEGATRRGRKGKRGRGGPPASTNRGGRKRKSPKDESPESEDKEKVKGAGSSLIDDNAVKDEITKQTEASCGDISTNTKSSSTTKGNTRKRRKTPSPSPSLPDDGVTTTSRRTRSRRDPPKSDKYSFDELYSVPEEPISSEEPPVIPSVSSTDDSHDAVVKKGKGKRGQPKRSKKTEQNPLSLESEEPLIATPEEPPTTTSDEPPTATSEEPPTTTLGEPPTATSEEPPTATSEEPPTVTSEEPPPPASVSSIASSEDPVKPKSTRSRRQPRATKKSKKMATEEQLSDQESLDKEPLPDKSGEHPTSANEDPPPSHEEPPSSKSKRPRRQPAASKKKKATESLSENESEDPLATDDDIDTKKTLPKSKKLKGSVLELEKMKPPSNGKKKETASLAESPPIPSLSHTKRSTSTRSTPRRTLKKGATDSPLPPSVLFTGVTDEEAEDIVTELGGSLVDSAADCTHCVTDKVRRTVKFLCCLAKGCHIVSTKWLKDCHREGRFIPVDPYIIKDSATEKQYKFSLKNSITAARKNSLLSGWRVFLTENIKPSPSDMTFIINCAGGEVIKKCPTESEDDTFIISCDMDKKSLSPVSSLGIPVCTSEVILTGVLQQKLELDKYQLNTGSLSSVSGSATPKKASKRRRQ